MNRHLKHLIRQLLAPRWRPAWRLILTGLLAHISFLALSAPGESAAFEHMDKVLHVSAFACLACVASWCWTPSRHGALWVALGLALYGASIEWLQSQLPLREASLADWVADAVGIALGLALAHAVRVHGSQPGGGSSKE